MSSLVVASIYLLALAIPLFLLFHFHPKSWYWHMLCVAGALALGFVPTPPEWKTPGFDMAFGFAFIFLMVWGVGGLVLFPAGHGTDHRHRHHHA